MKYDVAIIGAGVSGASIARQLSLYNLQVALVDKEADVSFGTSKANSGIIHAGFHSSSKYLKSVLEVRGNLMFDRLQKELGFPFKRCGILMVAFREEEIKTVQYLYQQGVDNGVIGIEICSRERLLELEPKLNPDVIGGLHAPNGGIIEPYRFVFSLVESAKKNGVEVILDFKINQAKMNNDVYHISAEDGRKIEAKYVINAAGVFADQVSEIFGGEKLKIIPRKGEEYLLDRLSPAYPNKVIFPVPAAKSKGMLVIPTVEGTMMVGPTAVEQEDKEDLSTSSENLERIFDFAKHLIPAISQRDIITSFAGLRPAMESGDFFIDLSEKAKNLIQVAGIQSPGLTAAPAIGEYVKDLLKKLDCPLHEKKDYDPFISTIPRMREIEHFEAEQTVRQDPSFGNIICRCEKVSEAEIVEAIKRGHTTLDGIKFFTRTGMGRCQGGFCTYKIIKLIMRETGKSFDEITKRGKNSYLLKE
ncbi:MAG: NAD(P)/FAD-dependent oxidoreductase, partial [Spirochaetes bacterium]|nr:NAD(P)/FAD-dependent oxidoreductase [Spirochaetota bacterium]